MWTERPGGEGLLGFGVPLTAANVKSGALTMVSFPGGGVCKPGGQAEGFLDVGVQRYALVFHVVLECARVPAGAVLDWTVDEDVPGCWGSCISS